MNESIEVSFSKQRMEESALSFMEKHYGQSVACELASEIDRWHEKYGMLMNFIRGIFPSAEVNKHD